MIKMNTKLASFAFVVMMGSNLASPMPTTATGEGAGFRADLRNFENSIGTATGNFRKEIRNEVQNFKNSRGVVDGNVTAVGTSSITVNANGTSIQVDISSTTRFARRFWGKSSLSEISVGDKVGVVGKWTSDAKTEITAYMIRDMSIQKRYGVFFGKITSLNSTGFVFDTIHRSTETVTIGSAKLINRKEVSISQSDIQVGDFVRVKGIWDSATKTITEVKEVKDFSLPPFASGSPFPGEDRGGNILPSPSASPN